MAVPVKTGVQKCVCALYRQAFGVDHPADKEQRPWGFIPNQVEEGAVHSVCQVVWGCVARVLIPLRRRLHRDLVIDRNKFGSLSGDFLQLRVV